MIGYSKAKKFINKHGIDFALEWLGKNIAHTPTHGKYVDIDSELNPKGIISTSYYGGFHVEHLVKLTGYKGYKMNNTEKCLVEGCKGMYVTKVIKVIERRNGRKINVTESLCNQCGDDQDERLVRFIRENL